MSRRFFTADFHFGMSLLLDKQLMNDEARPFQTVADMNEALIGECNKKARVYLKDDESQNQVVDKDVIVHVGDLACFKLDRDKKGIEISPQALVQRINATFINIRGNHDVNNRVKSLCNCMQTCLGKRFPNVTVGHYPSYDIHAKDTFKEGWIHICGHVHKKWKYCLDVTHSVLNVNVGVDVWNYKIVSEEELIQYIESILRKPKDQINKVKIVGNKIVNFK